MSVTRSCLLIDLFIYLFCRAIFSLKEPSKNAIPQTWSSSRFTRCDKSMCACSARSAQRTMLLSFGQTHAGKICRIIQYLIQILYLQTVLNLRQSTQNQIYFHAKSKSIFILTRKYLNISDLFWVA